MLLSSITIGLQVDVPNSFIAVSRLIAREVPGISITNRGNWFGAKRRTTSAVHGAIVVEYIAHLSFVQVGGRAGEKRKG